MILYLLKSSFCLAILLAVYHLFLEKEKMHQFNRFYLLGSILFSFLAPTFIIYTNALEIIEEIVPLFQETPNQLLNGNLTQTNIQEESINYKKYLFILYGFIATILLIRFSKNVFVLIQKIKSNTKTTYKNATLVLLAEKLIPHTFLSYIFINKREFQSNKLEKELFEHELTHVREKHTIDIFIVELLQIICWFNPLIIYLKRAIKLNHEFIADSNVIQFYNNTIEYQHLLLSKVSQTQHSYLASNFNYSLTKKRLQMMTKQSSQLKMLLKKIAIIPLAIALIFVFANRVEAKEKDNAIETNYEQPQNDLDVLSTELQNEEAIETWDDNEPSATNNFLASVERTENSIRLKCYDCYRWADLKLKLNTEYIINDFGFSEGKTIKRDKYAFTIKATENKVVFKGLKNTTWKDLNFTLNKGDQQFFNQVGMVSSQKNPQEKVTPQMIAEYNSLAKKYNAKMEIIFKYEEIKRLKYIYSLMSATQKETAESFPNIPPPPKVVKGKKLLPPPPIPANATKAQKAKYVKAIEKYKKETKNVYPPLPPKPEKVVKGKLVPPPPIPENATKAEKLKYKKAMEKYKKETKNLPPPPPAPKKKEKS